MKYIISGTDRPGSRTLDVSRIIQAMYEAQGEQVEIIDLRDVDLAGVSGCDYGSTNLPPQMAAAIDKINTSDGLIVVCPEYNGSMPGALKYFIDFWTYPDSFEFRPVAFVGLGGRFGGLRPVEHLQQVFGYRNAYVFPVRVFLSDIWSVLKDGEIQDPRLLDLLRSQVQGFRRFVEALRSQELDANTLLRSKNG